MEATSGLQLCFVWPKLYFKSIVANFQKSEGFMKKITISGFSGTSGKLEIMGTSPWGHDHRSWEAIAHLIFDIDTSNLNYPQHWGRVSVDVLIIFARFFFCFFFCFFFYTRPFETTCLTCLCHSRCLKSLVWLPHRPSSYPLPSRLDTLSSAFLSLASGILLLVCERTFSINFLKVIFLWQAKLNLSCRV